ncbi:hypothetical protein H101_01794 [Trichophyton interdigitale H6]|nr:hypothetical protein H101_01794 [Trichophyton interdigitale H6]
MDAFPPSYVDHNLPLVLISGLAAAGEAGEEAGEAIVSGVDGADGGVCVFSDFPPVSGAVADGLLAALLAEDASFWPWSSRYFSHKANGVGLRIQRASRTYTLPRKKADTSQYAPDSDGLAPVPHSPLSPLTPGSEVFPDGMVTPSWISKHQCLVPAAFVNFFPLTTDTNMSTLKDNQLKIEINSLKRDWAQSGYKTRFVVVFLFDDGPVLDDANFRISSIRKATGLDPRNVFTLPPGPSPLDIQRFVKSLLFSIRGAAVEYYRDLSKHSRRKRNRTTIPPPTAPPTSGTSQTLSQQGWNVRYEFKLGVLAEFRQEMDAAGRSYETAYDLLFGDEVFGAIAAWSPRFDEARMLADVLALRILRCHFWLEQTTPAVQFWAAHRRRIQNIAQSRGKGTNNYGWEAWEVNWSLIMAHIISRSYIPPSPVGTNSGPIFVLSEKTLLSGERVSPWDFLHHRGYWLARAAKHTARRRLHAKNIPQEDRLPPDQHNTTSQRKALSNVYDTYQAPEPHVEYPIDDRPGDKYSHQILEFLAESVAEFAKRGQVRMVEKQKFTMAKEYVRLEAWGDALDILRPLWLQISWRREGWWHLMEECAWLLRDCAVRCGDYETIYRIDWEIMNKNFTNRSDWNYDIHRTGTTDEKTSEKPVIVLTDKDVASCISMSFIFNSSSGNVGEPLRGQLVLQSDCSRKSSPIHLSEVKITFEGGLPPVRILADGNPADASESSHTHASISLADGQTGPSSLLQEIKGNANLTLFPGQTRAFTLTLIPREASDVRVASITLMVADDKFDLTYTISSTSNDAYALPRWWAESKGSITSRRIGKGRDPSSCQILPKPPKVLISVPGLRDAYYFGEKAGLNIRLDNNEDASASIVVELKLSGRSESPAAISWLDGADVEEHSKEIEELSASQTKEVATQTIRRKIAELGADEHTILPAVVVEAPHPIQYDLEISVFYHLSSDPEAAISKAISLDLPFIQPFEANYSFLPQLHLSPWPDFFNIDESEVSNTQQRWLLNSTLMSFAREALVIEDVKLRVVAIEVGKVCSITTASDSSKEPGNRYIRPEEPQSTDFIVVIERLVMEDRLQTGVSFELEIKWRRDEQQDVLEAEATSPEISLPTESVVTSLAVPRFSIPMSEPRVLASLGPETSHGNDGVPGLIQLNYTLENPSMHFLTFNLTMETSDQFAFSGPKSMTLRLVPLSRHTLQYSLLATRRGVWIQPQLVIVDTYFNKTLRILPTESIKSDAKGILIWVD